MAFTKCNVQKDVIGSLGTNPSERGLTTQQFKDKFDEMPEGIVDYLNNTLTPELDTLAAEFDTLATELDTLAAKMPNKNLLHNWDFRNPVNQRGLSVYTPYSTYTIDRWVAGATGTITIGTGKITLVCPENYLNFAQIIENPSRFAGMTLTFSVMCSGEVQIVFEVNGTFPATAVHSGATTDIIKTSITLPATVTSLSVIIKTNAYNSPANLYSAKLELGSVSTLANDPPADYGEELAKCQRYALNLPASSYRAAEYTSGTITFYIPTPATLRANPTLSAAPAVRTLNGSSLSGFTFAYTALPNCIKVVATKAGHNQTDATLLVENTIISADL